MFDHDITDPSAWRGPELTRDRSWRIELDDRAVAELEIAAAGVGDAGHELADVDRHRFPLDTLASTMSEIGHELRHGRGFVVLGGLPVERWTLDELERVFWGLCSHLGTGITQNSDASLIHYVTDGALRPNQGGRGVGRPERASLHVDLTDCAALLCVRQAPDEPQSWVASSTTVHNELRRRHPEVLTRLYEGFEWDRLGEEGPEELPTTGYRVPVFSEADGLVSCRYNRFWMAKALRREHDRLPDDARHAFDTFDAAADEVRLAFEFRPGDIQFINNYTVLHGRDGHEPVPDEAAKRLLMRVWLDFDEARPTADDAVVRYGIVRHGRLGWTAEQYRSGAHLNPHARRADGRPVVGHR